MRVKAHPTHRMGLSIEGRYNEMGLGNWRAGIWRMVLIGTLLWLTAPVFAQHGDEEHNPFHEVTASGHASHAGGLGATAWEGSVEGIAYSEFNEHEGRIRFLSLTGATWADLVVPGWSCFSAMAWASDGKGLFVTSMGANITRILYVDLQGHAYPLWNLPAFSVSWAVPSPDGRHLAVLRPTRDSNAWMLENF